MRKVRAAVMLVLFGIATLSLLVAPVLPVVLKALPDEARVSAGSRFSPSFERRFAYVAPQWDTTQWYTQGGQGSYKLSGTREQYFNLQSRSYAKTDGEDVSESTDQGVMTVFSSADMNAIAIGQSRVAVENRGAWNQWDEKDDNAAFMMLDNDEDINNRVLLELVNLTSITNIEAFYYSGTGSGSAFGRHTYMSPGIPGNLTNQNLIIDMGDMSTTSTGDLKDPDLYDYLADENADRVYWGRAANGEFQIRGMFAREGYYEFRLNVAVWGTNADRRITMRFGFYIGHVDRYINHNVAGTRTMPVFNLDSATGRPAGESFSAGLFRPSDSIVPINNDRFYYNYHDTFPTIQYNRDRYRVLVTMTDHNKLSQKVPLDVTNINHPRYEFNQLGMYTISAEMIFPIRFMQGGQEQTLLLRVSNFASHRYFLDIFGFQAQYWNANALDENGASAPGYSWFGGTDTRSGTPARVDSDRTSEFDENDFKITAATEAGRINDADNAIRKLVGAPADTEKGFPAYPSMIENKNMKSVVTNSSIVSLRYNVKHAYADESPEGRTHIMSRVAYRQTFASEWKFDTPYGNNIFEDYVIGKPFEAAGEYAVIVYYEYDAAEGAGTLYSQVFYFKINNFASEIMFTVTHNDPVRGIVTEDLSFADLMGTRGYMSSFMVYKADGGPFTRVGPFEVAPVLELRYTNFAGTSNGLIENFNPAKPSLSDTMLGNNPPSWYGRDGIYTFRVYYGNNSSKSHMPHMDFVAVVDTTPIQNFKCYQDDDQTQTGLAVRNGPNANDPVVPNASVFGGGEVTLEWERKASGVDMRVAKLDFYEFRTVKVCQKSTCNISECDDFHHSDQFLAERLDNQFNVRYALQRSLRIMPTESGFRLADRLSASGLYLVTIIDAAGNSTSYVIIIDTTVASFAQFEAVDPRDVNIKNDDVRVGFGKDKFIRAMARESGADPEDDEFSYMTDFFAEMQKVPVEGLGLTTNMAQALVNSGFFVNSSVDVGIKVQISSVEISTDAFEYHSVYNPRNTILTSTTAFNPYNPGQHNNHHINLQLYDERSFTYFFRLVDATGNIAEHYVEINPDFTKSIVFEDSIPNLFQGADNSIISRTATIVQDGRISNRDFLTFSFEQSRRELGTDRRVDQINVAFYALTFQRSIIERDADGNILFDGQGNHKTVPNDNYPFSMTPEVFTIYDGVADNEYDESEDRRVAININRAPRTRQGLYVIARICNNVSFDDANTDGATKLGCTGHGTCALVGCAHGNWTNIRHYTFIVDNNPIISNRNFETGITVQFGDAVETAPIARHNDFQRTNNARMNPDADRVLRSNTNASVRLPGTDTGGRGTKYGTRVTDANNRPIESKSHDSFWILQGDLLDSTQVAKTDPFASLSITKMVEWRAPNTDTFVRQAIKQDEIITLTQGGMFRVAFTDGSGGFSWVLGAEAPKPPDGNRSEILIELVHEGPRGTFALNGRQVSVSSYRNPNANDNTAIHSVRFGDKENDVLSFTYVVKDTSNFLHPVGSLFENMNSTTWRPITWHRANGTSEAVGRVERGGEETNRNNLLAGRAVVSQYVVGTVTFCEIILPLSAPLVGSGDRFDIQLTNGLPQQNRTLQLTLDNTPPKHNLNRIASDDAFWNDGDRRRQILMSEGYNTQTEMDKIVNPAGDNRIEIGNGNTLRYPFRMNNDFVFRNAIEVDAPNGVHTFDTFRISYFEVDSRLSNISGERSFAYGGITSFYDLVGMQPNQNRFFRIIERDEAGNRSDYFVQLRGDDFVDTIEASGIVEYRQRDGQGPLRPTGRHITGNFVLEGDTMPIRGYEMAVADVREFFANNLYFEFSAGNIMVRRLGFNTMIITGGTGNVIGPAVGTATPERFAAAVQQMFEAGRGGNANSVGVGGTTRFTLINRFKPAQGTTGFSWNVRQITRNTPDFNIREMSTAGSNITFEVNDSAFPGGIRNSENFIFEVYNLSTLNTGLNAVRTELGRRLLLANRFNEYLIVATDEFGRTARYSHNGLYGSHIELRYPVSMSERIIDNQCCRHMEMSAGSQFCNNCGRPVQMHLYVGSGVEVVYSTNAYDLEIYRTDPDGGERVLVFLSGRLLDATLSGHVVCDWNIHGDTRISLLPEENAIVKWNIVGIRRGTSERWERELFLYGELPTLRFMNQSGTTLDIAGVDRVTSGIVTVSYSFEGLLFGAGVEYTRTWTDANGNRRVDWHPISEFVTRYNFTREGVYVLTVTNALGFRSNSERYVFEIKDVSNRSYKVFFEYSGKYEEIEASPVSFVCCPPSTLCSHPFRAGIPNFFVRSGNGNSVELIEECGTSEKDANRLRIIPTTNSSREIRSYRERENEYYASFIDPISNVYTVVYRLVSTTTLAEEFFAVTLMSVNVLVGSDLETVQLQTLRLTELDESIQFDQTHPFTHPQFRIFYHPSLRPYAAVTVTLNREWLGVAGNILYVDYYRDGAWLGRLQGMQELRIHAIDYGIYTFRISDQAGNVRMFGAVNPVDYFTVMMLTRAPLQITEAGSDKPGPIIDGMIYNDAVTLTVPDLPANIFQSGGGSFIPAENFLQTMRVFIDDIERPALGQARVMSKDQSRNAFSFTEPGRYRIMVDYRVSNLLHFPSEYSFIIVSSTVSYQSFSFIAPPNTEIASIRLNGNEIRHRFADEFLSQIMLSTATGAGDYVITLRQGVDNIHQQVRTRTFKLIIRGIPRVDIFTTGVDFGKSTTGMVSLEINPRAIYTGYGECRIIVLRNNEEIVNVIIGSTGTINLVNERIPLLGDPLEENGQYRVFITSVDAKVEWGAVVGTVFYSQGFSITEPTNPLGTAIVVIIVIALIGALGFFIKLRMGVRTK